MRQLTTQDDGQGEEEANEVWGGPNGNLSLFEARQNFLTYGAVEKRFVANVRPPKPEELRVEELEYIPITPRQAYLAMYWFLDAYYHRGGSEELAMLLGSMSLLPDGRPADPAIAGDWEEAVRHALPGKVDASLTLKR